MNILIQLIKNLFIQQGIESITKTLSKTVAALEAHTDKTALKVDALHEAISDKVAFHQAEVNEMAYKAIELRNEAQKAASIARNIGALLNQ